MTFFFGPQPVMDWESASRSDTGRSAMVLGADQSRDLFALQSIRSAVHLGRSLGRGHRGHVPPPPKHWLPWPKARDCSSLIRRECRCGRSPSNETSCLQRELRSSFSSAALRRKYNGASVHMSSIVPAAERLAANCPTVDAMGNQFWRSGLNVFRQPIDQFHKGRPSNEHAFAKPGQPRFHLFDLRLADRLHSLAGSPPKAGDV